MKGWMFCIMKSLKLAAAGLAIMLVAINLTWVDREGYLTSASLPLLFEVLVSRLLPVCAHSYMSSSQSIIIPTRATGPSDSFILEHESSIYKRICSNMGLLLH